MPKLNKLNDIPWRILDTPEEIDQIYYLMKEYQLWNPDDKSIILMYGYKILSTGDKETYQVLKNLAMINQKSTGNPTCKVSLDYLAIALSTSTECQRVRIQNLKKYKLITTIIHKNHTANMYYMNMEPLPDTTFVATVEKLATRKRIYDLIRTLKHTNNIAEKMLCIAQIKDLDPTGEYQSQTLPHIINDTDISADAVIDMYEQDNLFIN